MLVDFHFHRLPFCAVGEVALWSPCTDRGNVLGQYYLLCILYSGYSVYDRAQAAFTFATAARDPTTDSTPDTNWIMAPSAFTLLMKVLLLSGLTVHALAYDPNDKSLKDILLPEGQFEAFYLKGSQEEEQNAVRPPHLHGSFHQYKNPALVGAPNSAAYGFRFDGKRRFNYD